MAVESARTAQAWVELKADDPEAVSALEVARVRLGAGSALISLRRLRLIELHGPLPDGATLSVLLHRSTRFYNPHKERCTLRGEPGETPPVAAGEQVVLVTERGGERRAAAERWWFHETGTRIIVREGVAWVLAFAPGAPTDRATAALTWLRDRRNGLFCNPNSQDARIAEGMPPRSWLSEAAGKESGGSVS